MPNTDLRDILKSGENFELQPLDLSKNSVGKRFEYISELQKISRGRKKYDSKLNDFYMRKRQN